MLLSKIYHIFPQPLKDRIQAGGLLKIYVRFYRAFMKHKVVAAMKDDGRDKEKAEIVGWLKHHDLSTVPYDYESEYRAKDIAVYREDGFWYVYYKDYLGREKKIYAPGKWDANAVRAYFNGVFSEQDPRSPHCYFQDINRAEMNNMIIADCGGAEGIFAISVIEEVKKVYIFECNKEWIPALERTFKDWEDKISIVEKYVGEDDSGSTVSLDAFFDEKDIDVIKADIEGTEEEMLKGGKKTFSEKISKVFMVAYHKHGDEDMIRGYLTRYGFDVSTNRGYMIPWRWFDEFKYPYIRRGVLYGEKAEK